MSVCVPARVSRWRVAGGAVSVVVAMWMSGCGPGTGGTGGGGGVPSAALAAFGATPANVCVSGPTLALACSSGGTSVLNPGSTVPWGSVEPVRFSDVTSGRQFELDIEGNHADFTARCLKLSFQGDWGLALLGNDARFFGYASAFPGAPAQLATLTVQIADSDNKVLRVSLFDKDGRVLMGPVLLQRVAVPPPSPVECPA